MTSTKPAAGVISGVCTRCSALRQTLNIQESLRQEGERLKVVSVTAASVFSTCRRRDDALRKRVFCDLQLLDSQFNAESEF